MPLSIPLKRLTEGCRFITVDAYVDAVPFYQKNGFLFMGTEERERYEQGKGDTVAMYFDL